MDRWSGRQAGRQAGRQVRTQVTESIWSSKAACRSHCTLCVDPAEAPCSSCIFLSMASPRSLARIRCKQALHALCLVAFVFFPNAQMQRPFTLGTCREAGQRPGHKLRHGHMLQPTLGTRREAGLRPGHKPQRTAYHQRLHLALPRPAQQLVAVHALGLGRPGGLHFLRGGQWCEQRLCEGRRCIHARMHHSCAACGCLPALTYRLHTLLTTHK